MASTLETSISDWYGNQMRKDVGNALWKYEHTLAPYVKKDPESQYKAFDALRLNVETFPCEKCSYHGTEWINDNPFDPSEGTIDIYISRFHNAVNEKIGKPIYPYQPHQYHQETLEVGTRDEVTKIDPKTGDEDILVESVPYNSFDVGLSFPLSPLPMSPSINLSLGQDWPFTVLPLPRKVIRDISGPWLPPIDELIGERQRQELEDNPILMTPKEIVDKILQEK